MQSRIRLIDFMEDQLGGRMHFRLFGTHEVCDCDGLGIEADLLLQAARVIRWLKEGGT